MHTAWQWRPARRRIGRNLLPQTTKRRRRGASPVSRSGSGLFQRYELRVDQLLPPPGETGEAQRRTGAALFVANLRQARDLRAGLTDEQSADAIWALSPDIIWNLLVVQRGWTPDEFEQWYAGQLAAAVLDDKLIAAVRRFSHTLITTATKPMPGGHH